MEMKTDERRLRYMKLPNTYTQSNGYKPQPLDVSSVILSSKMENLIEILAENTHNVWAQARIKDGFTYGVSDVSSLSSKLRKEMIRRLDLECSSETKSSSSSLFHHR